MNAFIKKGDIPGLIAYLVNSDRVILEDNDESRNPRKKVLILDVLKIKVPN